jgi:hypothetical protein
VISGEEDPKEPVGLAKSRLLGASVKDEELVPEGEHFEDKLRTVLDEGPEEGKEETAEEHRWLPE